METIYNKLVRDNIPEIIRKNNGEPKIKMLKQEEFLKELFKKLEEEAGEAGEAAADQQALAKEIGDVYEVIDAIIETCNLDRDKIMELKNMRKIERGGFEKRIFLESVNN